MEMEAAIREKEIAVTMMGNNNYMGAREKLMEARNHFPGLENIGEMIRVCDILCTTEIELSGGGTDWYWVLQTNLKADESHIECKYNSLISLLEPIKNKFPGTESALKLVKNAYFVLSDREKRAEFDLKQAASRYSYGFPEVEEPSYPEIMNNVNEATSISSSGSKRIASEFADTSNGVCNSRELPSKRSKNVSGVDPDEITIQIQVIDKLIEKICSQEESRDSACQKTKPNEEEIWLGSPSGSPAQSREAIPSKAPELDFYDFGDNKKTEVFAVGQIWAAYDLENMPRNYARIDGIENSPFQLYVTWLKPAPVDVDERKWHEAGLPISCGYFKLGKSDMVVGGRWVFSHLVNPVHGSINEPVEVYPQKGEVWALYRDWQPFDWCSDPETRKGCKLQLVEILTDYSKYVGVRVVWVEKVPGFRSVYQRCKDKGSESSSQISAANLFIFSHNIPAFRFTGGEMDFVPDGMFELDPFSVPEDVVVDTVTAKPPLTEAGSGDGSGFKQHLSAGSPPITSVPSTTALTLKWSHEDFNSGQLWAIHDGPDFMPRRYAIVNDVVPGGEVCVTYLDPHPMLEDEINWVKQGLPSVFGLFRTGETVVNLDVSRFSHLVKCKNSSNTYFHRIYPQKGEIWAMYKNWNQKWKLSNLSSCQYRFVEILSDFSDTTAMIIASLVVVKGHQTFFQRELCDGFALTCEVSKKEMLSFSHRIPAFTVPGIENLGIPEGSWHLEPDALPPMFTN